MLSIFSCVCWPSVCLLWRKVCLGFFPTFWLGVGDGQGGLACCNSWGCKGSDTTERLNWTELFCFGQVGSVTFGTCTELFLVSMPLLARLPTSLSLNLFPSYSFCKSHLKFYFVYEPLPNCCSFLQTLVAFISCIVHLVYPWNRSQCSPLVIACLCFISPTMTVFKHFGIMVFVFTIRDILVIWLPTQVLIG